MTGNIYFQVHVFLGILGIALNTVAFVVFIKLGRVKPYYIIIIFETLTDLIVCFVAIYTGVFLISGWHLGVLFI